MSRPLFQLCATLAALLCAFAAAAAESPDRIVARISDQGAVFSDEGTHVELTIGLTQPVPWRVFTLDRPARLVVDISELLWDAKPKINSDSIAAVNVGPHYPGWSRLVAGLREPMIVDTAEMSTIGGKTRLQIKLLPATPASFRKLFAVEQSTIAPYTSSRTEEYTQVRVAIDPGHGGLDPGAEAGQLVEAAVMLRFARQLKETLLRSGRFDVVLTREGDEFVPLEKRMTIARAARANIFLSLHADALEPDAGPASGMTVYTLPEDEAEVAALQLTERHASDDILSGVDLGDAEDDIKIALLDLARRETTPRSQALAAALVEGFEIKSLAITSKPHRRGSFAVLKAAEMPSVLIELGFLSNARDRTRLSSDKWSRDAAEAIRLALELWADADFLRSQELRR